MNPSSPIRRTPGVPTTVILGRSFRDLPYREPLGLPLYWMDDQTGRLPGAVMAYYAAALGEGTITPAQLVDVRDYVAYVVNAPCWGEIPADSIEPGDVTLAELRTRAAGLAPELGALNDFVQACLGLGIDPL